MTDTIVSIQSYKPTEIYRALLDANSIWEIDKFDNFKTMTGHKLAGNTWDAKHLDQFISNNTDPSQRTMRSIMERSKSVSPGKKV